MRPRNWSITLLRTSTGLWPSAKQWSFVKLAKQHPGMCVNCIFGHMYLVITRVEFSSELALKNELKFFFLKVMMEFWRKRKCIFLKWFFFPKFRLVEKMTKDGHAVALLSGELTVEDRIQVLDRFRDGLEKILITTNVMARG